MVQTDEIDRLVVTRSREAAIIRMDAARFSVARVVHTVRGIMPNRLVHTAKPMSGSFHESVIRRGRGEAGPQNASRREAAHGGEYWSPGLLRPDRYRVYARREGSGRPVQECSLQVCACGLGADSVERTATPRASARGELDRGGR